MANQPRFALYGMGSPNVRKVLLMLEELEVAYDLQLVKVFGSEQFTPQFRALNPLSKVPVLVDHEAQPGGYPVFESGAILIYLAEAFGRFLPASGVDRYETLKWLFVQTSNVGPVFGQFNHFRMGGKDRNPYAYERFRSLSTRLYQLLDERLARRPYLAGDSYSIADIATFAWASYVDIHGMDWADYPNLARWLALIAARPAAQREEAAKAQLAYAPADSFAAASKEDMDRFWWRG
jgi:GST-like protein